MIKKNHSNKLSILIILISLTFFACTLDSLKIDNPNNSKLEASSKNTLTEKALFNNSDLLGKYIREPAQNTWHTGTISESNSNFKWTNEAGVSWTLIPNLDNNQLLLTDDCPYYEDGRREFTLKVEGNSLEGFYFQNELYVKEKIQLSLRTVYGSTET